MSVSSITPLYYLLPLSQSSPENDAESHKKSHSLLHTKRTILFSGPFYVTIANTWGQAFYKSQRLTSRNKKAWDLVLRIFKRERKNWGSPGHLVEPQCADDPWCLLFDILTIYRLAPYYWDRSKALVCSTYL